MGKFAKFCLKGFIGTPIDALCSNFVTFGRRKIGEVVRYLPHKNLAWLSSSRCCGDRACQDQPQPKTTYSEYCRFHPKIGSLPVELHPNA